MNKEMSVSSLLQGKKSLLGIFSAGQVLDKTPTLSSFKLFGLEAWVFLK